VEIQAGIDRQESRRDEETERTFAAGDVALDGIVNIGHRPLATAESANGRRQR
jgi:hypothetical protein